MKVQHLLTIFLSVFLLLAYGVEFKYIKYCGPEDNTFHLNVTPWPVITSGQDLKITLTFTPRVYVIYATMQTVATFTSKEGKSFPLGPETADACIWYPQICGLPSGETVSKTFIERIRNIPHGFKGFSGKARMEVFNEEQVMFLCFEVEVDI